MEIKRGYTKNAPGSVLIRNGRTVVLCTASWEPGVPLWKQGQGTGWLTAEYDMLPTATHQRRARNRTRIDGRTQEIQRIIGRSLRAVIDFSALGENTILLDCDVLQADGGTRTAAITGAYVALNDAVEVGLANQWISRSPIREPVAAVSVCLVNKRPLLDPNYEEDAAAEVDLNVVMGGSGRLIEIQGTGEQAPFSRAELDKLLRMAASGIRQLIAAQEKTLRRAR